MIKSTIRKIMDDVQTISYKQLENRLEKYSEISFDIANRCFQTHGKMHERR